ncbi:MAG: DsbA family protein [Sediminibacterium sp.]|nr:DsbA family protein [Sediminibacterium sp.]
MKPTLYYCYDAYCGWCYGFSAVMKQVAARYQPFMHIEVLSGGMVLPEQPTPISVMATYIKEAYPTVEEYTGVKFGRDYLWHIENPDLSDWYPHSEMPAIALSIFKELYPEQQVAFASDIQFGLYGEGRDLTDPEAYRHLLEKYEIDANLFYDKLKQETYRDKAHEEFALCKQLQATGYPYLVLQTAESKFFLVARGYTSYADVHDRIQKILKESGHLPNA